MEDNNTSGDDETKDSPVSPKMVAKKIKLNDGSSQDSLQDAEGTSTKEEKEEEKDENADSGVSADKSESTSSDDRAAAGEGPSNEVVTVAPSTSNVRAILLNIRQHRNNRTYRKRKTPGRDSDSNDSSRDSDDLSTSENQGSLLSPMPDDSSSDNDSEIVNRLMNNITDSDTDTTGRSSDDGSSSYVNDDVHMPSGDTDSEEDLYLQQNAAENDAKTKIPTVLTKTRPKHNYLMLREIINREMGLSFPVGKAAKTDVMFEQKFYGSLHVVYRMKKLHSMHKHKGCVNSINFHPEGHLLASGSDDMNVVVWDWARNAALHTIKTGHKSNVFQSKFLYLNARSQLNIVTCARDGQVRLVQCPASGSSGALARRGRRLTAHARAAHRLHVTPHEPHLVYSAGADGVVKQCDVRTEKANTVITVYSSPQTSPVALHSVCGHPLQPRHIMVAGRDKFVRVYDTRKPDTVYAQYSPSTFDEHSGNPKKKIGLASMHLTCAIYNHDGSEILSSYNDEDIYLFDAMKDVYDKDDPTSKPGYTHRYSGHRNSATFKGVAFFGPKSQYIVSGSDCSYIYIWEKNSEAIVQWMKGDVNGVVNCIETHPRSPVMATSGLDKDVKIWIPRNYKDPTYEGLERVVRQNVSSQLRSPLFNDFLPALYSVWRGEAQSSDDDGPHGNIEFDGNVCTAM